MQGLSWVIVVSLLVAVLSQNCPQQQSGAVLFSQWSATKNLTDPSGVQVAANEIVVVDQSPGVIIEYIDVFGQLVFDDVDGLIFNIRKLMVENGGQLWIGSESCPLTKKITITLFGQTQNPKTLPPLENANKVIGAFAGGKIDIHGNIPSATWTHLGDHAGPGDCQITLASDISVDWVVGDEIVIANTDFTHRSDTAPFDPTQNDLDTDERRTITSVSSSNGNTILGLDTCLEYVHYGRVWQTPDNTDSIDMRAEVIMLTRNIVISGDITEGTTLADHWGGHLMVQDQCSLRVEGVEFYYMGQKDNLARYPVHMHECGDTSDTYVKHNSFHDTFQRCVTIHGTNYATIQNNVAFNSSGHCFFVEDGNEIGNVFDHNCGIRANPHTLLVTADLTPAIFWITNPNNTWTNNVAVAGWFGFWFSLPDHPLGIAQNPAYDSWNRHLIIGLFKGNKAHSNVRKGLHFDDGLQTSGGMTQEYTYHPIDWEPYISDLLAQTLFPEGSDWGLEDQLEQLMYQVPQGYSLVQDFTAFKNIEHGIWGRAQYLHVTGAKLADNQCGAQFPGDANIIENSIIVGETDNQGNPMYLDNEQLYSRFYRWCPDCTIFGFQHYDGGSPDLVRNVKFYNFKHFYFQFDGGVRHAGATRVTGGRGVLPPRNKYYNVQYINAPNHIYLEPSVNSSGNIYQGWEPNLVSAVVIDADGSITGQCGSEIVYPSPIMYTSACQNYSNWNAMVCPPGHKPHRHFSIQDYSLGNTGVLLYGTPEDLFMQGTARVYRLPDYAEHLIPANIGQTADYGGAQRQVHRDSYQANLLSNTNYIFIWGSYSSTPNMTTIHFSDASKGEFIRVGIPYPAGTTFSFAGSEYSSYTAASDPSGVDYKHYYYDTNTNLLWVHLEVKKESYRYDYGQVTLDDDIVMVINATCPGSCTQYVDPTTITSPWDDAPAPTTNPTCENTGNLAGGTVSFKSTSDPYLVFDETTDVEWQINPWSYNFYLNTDMASSGSTSLRVDFGQQGFGFSRINSQKVIAADAYQYFCFKARSAPGRGQIFLAVNFGANSNDLKIDPDLFGVGNVNNPNYCGTAPIDDLQWHQVCIPLADLGHGPAPLNDNLWSFGISSYYNILNTTVYFDEIGFGNYDKTFTSTNPPTGDSSAYSYASDPYNAPLPTVTPWWQTQGGSSGAVGFPPGSDNTASYVTAPSSTTTASSGAPSWAVPVVVVLAVLSVGLIVAVVVLALKLAKGSEHV